MQLNTGQWVVLILAGVLILDYILGYFANRQRAEHIVTWLRKGLSTLGTVTAGEKIPGMATGGRLEVNQASAPFKRVEAVYLLAPRDNLLFLIFHLLQGRGDELIVWISTQGKPHQSVEVARQGDRQFAKRLQAADKVKLHLVEAPKHLQAAAEDVHGAQELEKVLKFAEQHTASLIRLAVRPEKPHVFLRVNLRHMSRLPAEQLFAELKQLVS
jgi:hypothetical protein